MLYNYYIFIICCYYYIVTSKLTVFFIGHRPGLPSGLGEIKLGTKVKVILSVPTYISLRDFTVG